MSAVVVVAVFTPLDGRTGDLRDALRAGIEATHAEPGCLLYAIHDADDGTITMIEKWESRAALDAHATGEAIALASAVTHAPRPGSSFPVSGTTIPSGLATKRTIFSLGSEAPVARHLRKGSPPLAS